MNFSTSSTYGATRIEQFSKKRKKHERVWVVPIAIFSLISLVMMIFAALHASRSEVLPESLTDYGSPSFTKVSHDGRFVQIWADNLFEAGLAHGEFAATRIQKYFQRREMQNLFDHFLNGEGRSTFDALKRDNTEAFLSLAEEIRGIAQGSGQPVDKIWVANLVNDLETFMDIPPIDIADQDISLGGGGLPGKGCTDVFAHDDDGYVLLGHNDDWTADVRPLWYFLQLNPRPSSNTGLTYFPKCTGVAYPGTIIGWAPTWNEHGIYHDQNTLMPEMNKIDGGLAAAFAQRNAICGTYGASETLPAWIGAMATGNWAIGASLNVMDVRENKIANMEIWENRIDIYQVSGNYSHTNNYKRLAQIDGKTIDRYSFSDDRESRLHEMKIPHSVDDIRMNLGDTEGKNVPIYRDGTLVTVIADAKRQQVLTWIGKNPKLNDPDIIFEL